jgi:hypothetical protein
MMRRVLWPVAGLFLLAACSSPPEKERHQAEGAIAAAREAGADVYAAADLKAAEAALDKYTSAVAQRDYRQALSAAVEARDTAYQAARRAADGKAAARSQAERLLAETTRLLQAAHTRLASPAGRGAAGVKLRAAATAAEPAVQEARAKLAGQDYAAVLTALTPIEADLRAEIEPASAQPAHRQH